MEQLNLKWATFDALDLVCTEETRMNCLTAFRHDLKARQTPQMETDRSAGKL
jgi:hypothetical protein